MEQAEQGSPIGAAPSRHPSQPTTASASTDPVPSKADPVPGGATGRSRRLSPSSLSGSTPPTHCLHTARRHQKACLAGHPQDGGGQESRPVLVRLVMGALTLLGGTTSSASGRGIESAKMGEDKTAICDPDREDWLGVWRRGVGLGSWAHRFGLLLTSRGLSLCQADTHLAPAPSSLHGAARQPVPKIHVGWFAGLLGLAWSFLLFLKSTLRRPRVARLGPISHKPTGAEPRTDLETVGRSPMNGSQLLASQAITLGSNRPHLHIRTAGL
ncbi:hypothetical protein VTK73DRAFT_3683 [Phialemonium thermophilum]|uniref:Uncharacterized protein n=1 Tax=Phialemonium thermophilum TaxID=223376 RepID=A0ABR3VGC6_9PEZI